MDNVQLYDGTTTIDLNDGVTYRLVNWLPSYEGREVIRFEVLGTPAQIAAGVRAVEAVLDAVKRWVILGLGTRWWIQWTPSNLSNEVESEIVYNQRQPNKLRQGDRHSRRWELIVERNPWWMGPEVSVSTTNVNSPSPTIDTDVDNTDDASRDNWVEIDSSEVDGDMPALVGLSMTQNTSGESVEIARYGLRVNYSGAAWQKYVLENDEATTISGSQSAGATYSGGNYHSGTLSGVTDIAMWRVISAVSREFNGFWRLLVRGDFPGNVWVSARTDNATFGSATELLATTPVDGTGGPFVDLGILRLPPWPEPRVKKSYPFELVVRGDGSGSWWLDYLMLMPAQEGFRVMSYDAAYWTFAKQSVDDGFENEAGMSSGTNRMHNATMLGKRLELVPGFDQRVYFYQIGIVGGVDNDIDRQLTIRIGIRPRYRFFES